MTSHIFRIPVGADALIGPLHRLPLTSRPAAAKREAEAMRQPSRQPPHHPPRDGSIHLVEENSVPEGTAKSEQAPIRRLPSARRHEGAGARPSGLFFWTVHGPFSFPQDGKENGGCILAGQAPLREQESPWPPSGGPHLPGRLITAPRSCRGPVPPGRCGHRPLRVPHSPPLVAAAQQIVRCDAEVVRQGH